MKVSIISAGIHRGSGGPTKTIGAFKKALDAELFSFCDPHQLKRDPLAIDTAHAVTASGMPVCRQFRWVPPSRRVAPELAVRESNIISSHSFYRYHSLLVCLWPWRKVNFIRPKLKRVALDIMRASFAKTMLMIWGSHK